MLNRLKFKENIIDNENMNTYVMFIDGFSDFSIIVFVFFVQGERILTKSSNNKIIVRKQFGRHNNFNGFNFTPNTVNAKPIKNIY